MKTLNDFKQEVAVENDYQNWSYLNEYETSYAVLDFSDQAAERYKDYCVNEAKEEKINEALKYKAVNEYARGYDAGYIQGKAETDKQSILKGLK